MENGCHPCTTLSMDTAGAHLADAPIPGSGSGGGRDLFMIQLQEPMLLGPPPDINLPVMTDTDPAPNWGFDIFDMHDGSAASENIELEVTLNPPKSMNGGGGSMAARRCEKRAESIWGAWFFFTFYFKPVLSDKAKPKPIIWDTGCGTGTANFSKSDLRLDVFLVQRDMENMYMWVFKERPENALGKMQLRSYMNGNSRQGDPPFPFSTEKGFARSHRMQRKQYRGLSNPQCIHGIEVVLHPNFSAVPEADLERWVELTGREHDFVLPPEAGAFEAWQSLPSTDFELEHPAASAENGPLPPARKQLNGPVLNLSTRQTTMNQNSDEWMDISSNCNKRKKESFAHGTVCHGPRTTSLLYRDQDFDPHFASAPSWVNDFSGVMKHANGPVTAAKTIYEDDKGYLLIVSTPFVNLHSVKVAWRNTGTNGVVKISCVSTSCMPYIRRHNRIFKLADPLPEHCPPGEFVREIVLPSRIPEDAKLQAYYCEDNAGIEIVVPKHSLEPEEHEVLVCMRPPHWVDADLMFT